MVKSTSTFRLNTQARGHSHNQGPNLGPVWVKEHGGGQRGWDGRVGGRGVEGGRNKKTTQGCSSV